MSLEHVGQWGTWQQYWGRRRRIKRSLFILFGVAKELAAEKTWEHELREIDGHSRLTGSLGRGETDVIPPFFLKFPQYGFVGRSKMPKRFFKESGLVAGIKSQLPLYLWNGFWLVVSNMTFIFHNSYGMYWDVILPIDELIFFKMVKTTSQVCNLNPD